jgi:hypothetical protein
VLKPQSEGEIDKMESAFELDEKGLIKMCPLSSWSTATLPQDGILLRLEVVPRPDALDTEDRIGFQVAMKRSQAIALAQALTRAAQTPYLPRA